MKPKLDDMPELPAGFWYNYSNACEWYHINKGDKPYRQAYDCYVQLRRAVDGFWIAPVDPRVAEGIDAYGEVQFMKIATKVEGDLKEAILIAMAQRRMMV